MPSEDDGPSYLWSSPSEGRESEAKGEREWLTLAQNPGKSKLPLGVGRVHLDRISRFRRIALDGYGLWYPTSVDFDSPACVVFLLEFLKCVLLSMPIDLPKTPRRIPLLVAFQDVLIVLWSDVFDLFLSLILWLLGLPLRSWSGTLAGVSVGCQLGVGFPVVRRRWCHVGQ